MQSICSRKLCTGCGGCAAKCFSRAITMKEDEEGFFYPEISQEACTDCGLCKKICPVNREYGNQNAVEAEFLAGYHTDRKILRQSSSGGAFSALAETILENHGVVFGAITDQENHRVYHTMISKKEELSQMRLSKYYQSEIQEVYQQAKEQLVSGRQVLFTGTACQIAGLFSYLGGSRQENLVTVDILCHGVASKKIVDEYLKSQEEGHKEKIKSFHFRVKEGRYGWQRGEGTRMNLIFENGKKYTAERPYDTYFLGFNHNFFLRESCYWCQHCGLSRISDITLADYWGCTGEEFREEERWNGISLLVVNSTKGQEMLPVLKERMYLKEARRDIAIAHNRALVSPQPRPEIRDRFFSMVARFGYDKTIKKIYRKRFLKYGVKCMIRKVFPAWIQKKILKNV